MKARKHAVGRTYFAKTIAERFDVSETKANDIVQMLFDLMRQELKNGNIVNLRGIASLRLHPIAPRTWKAHGKEFHTKKKYNISIRMGEYLSADCMEELPDVR